MPTVMDEPAFHDQTAFRAQLLPILDRQGAESRIVIVKATYAIEAGTRLCLADDQREIRLGDEPWGPPEIADVRLPGDYCACKPGTDFILSGHAMSPGHVPRDHVDVGIRVADRIKLLRVHGPRTWRRTATGIVPGPSAPMQATPLAWSLAFGGIDLTDPDRPLEEPRNPVGLGVARDPGRLIGMPAPQIEDPGRPVSDTRHWTVPVGCAPLGRHFEPRRSAAGSYDATWLQEVYPGRPADYREEHENCATPELVFREPLRGGERVSLVGVAAEGPIAFTLPKWRVLAEAEIDGRTIDRRPHLDTVLVDTDVMVVELVWRALFRCPPKMRNRFTVVRVMAKEFIG